MAQNYLLSFIKGVELEKMSADHTAIHIPVTCETVSLTGLAPGLSGAIDLLASTGATEDELAFLVQEKDGPEGLAGLYYYLLIFAERRMISYSVSCDGRRYATLAPASAHFRFSPAPIDAQTAYTLSRFAYLHREGKELALESPLTHGKIILQGWEAAAVVAELAGAQTPGSLCGLLPGVPSDSVLLLLEMLHSTGYLSDSKSGEANPAESETLAQWDFHDLLFHARSRLGRHANGFGGTYRFQGKIAPLPAVKPFSAGPVIDLYKPDMERLEEEDYPLSLVLERRRSIREYAAHPMTDRQLGEFLYRAARVRELIKSDIQDVSRRPYPGGGAIYELEIYATVNDCENIPPGLYHYCPSTHRLETVCGRSEATDALLKDAVRSTGQEERPQVLIIIAARFQRLSWKYESMAYNVMLKNVGVLYQTMYLVATAMDLAPCALGGGNSDLFARAAGLDYFAETSVGEFLLGSKRI